MNEWTAHVEWSSPQEYDTDAFEILAERLVDLHAAVGHNFQPVAASPAYAAVVTVEANTLRQAIATALQRVEDATGEKATAIEVLDADVHGARLDQPSIPELVGFAEIAEMFGVSRQRARQLADLAGFPVAVVDTAAGPLRVRRHVEAWGETWARKNGRPRKSTVAE